MNQAMLMPAANSTAAAPTMIRMVPDMWGSFTTSRTTTPSTAP